MSKLKFKVVQLSKAPMDGAKFSGFDCGDQFLNGISQKLITMDGDDLKSYVVFETQTGENRFVGFVTLALKPMERKKLALPGQSGSKKIVTIHLDFVAVDKKYQGQGLGLSLLKAAFTAAYGMSQLTGGVSGISLDAHPGAVQFYLNAGFSEITTWTTNTPKGPLDLTLMYIPLGTIGQAISPPPP